MRHSLGKSLSLMKAGLVRCERGATAIEYALVLTMIALAVIGSMTLVANKTINMWGNVSNRVNNS